MVNTEWVPTELNEKFGIAITNFDGSKVNDGLDIILGRFIHIYEKCGDWYRGCLYDQHHRLGIFPKNTISLKRCKVQEGKGLLEKLNPDIDPLVLRISYFMPYFVDEMLENYTKAHVPSDELISKTEKSTNLYTVQLSAILAGSHYQKDMYANQLNKTVYTNKKVCFEQHWESNIGNFNVLRKNFDSLLLPKISPASVLYPIIPKTRTCMASNRNNSYNLFIEKKSSNIIPKCRMQIVVGIFSTKTNEYTSELLVCDSDNSPNLRICGIIKDVTNIQNDQMLLIKIFRIGKMLDDKSNKASSDCRRPLYYGALDMRECHDSGDKVKDVKIHLNSCSDAEFCLLDGKKLLESTQDSEISEFISLRIKKYDEPIEDILKFPNIIEIPDISLVNSLPRDDCEKSPSNSGFELYIHLKKLNFERMSKGKELNIKIRISVFLKSSLQRDCIYYGSSTTPIEEYESPVVYHNNNPVYNDLIKISTHNDVSNLEVRFRIYHVSRNQGKNQSKGDLAFTLFNPISYASKSLARPNEVYILMARKMDLVDFHSKASLIDSDYVLSYVPMDEKIKSSSDFVLIRSQIVTDSYTTDETISKLLNSDINDTENISKIARNLEIKVKGPERRKFCVKIMLTIWKLLENNKSIPEIYTTTLNRFKDMKSSNISKEEILEIFSTIENAEIFYGYFIANMKNVFNFKQDTKLFQQTLKSIDILIQLLWVLCGKCNKMKKEQLQNDLYDILISIQFTDSNEHLQAHSLYANELPNILHYSIEILNYQQQISIIKAFYNFPVKEPWFFVMKLFEEIVGMPIFYDKDSHNSLCDLISNFITTINRSKKPEVVKAYYLNTMTVIKFFENHADFAEKHPETETIDIACALYAPVTSLFILTCSNVKISKEVMVSSIVCLFSFLKLFNKEIIDLIFNQKDPMFIVKNFCSCFNYVMLFKDIPANYKFSWGFFYYEISRISTLIILRILEDISSGGKKRKSSCIFLLKFTIVLILGHEDHLALFSKAERHEYDLVYSKLSIQCLYLIQQLYQALKEDMEDTNLSQDIFKEFIKICLIPDEDLSHAAIRVLLEIVKLKFIQSTDPMICDQISMQLIPIIYTQFNDSGKKSTMVLSDFALNYKKISETFWNEDMNEMFKDDGLTFIQSTTESINHMVEQSKLLDAKLSPFLTIYTAFKNVLYNWKRNTKLLPTSLFRYVEMLLELNSYEEAAESFFYLANMLEWNDEEVDEIVFVQRNNNLTNSKFESETSINRSSMSDLILPSLRIPPSDTVTVPEYLPKQSSKVRKIIYIEYAISIMGKSYHKLKSLEYMKVLLNYYESLENSAYYKDISEIYSMISSLYTYTITAPVFSPKFYYVGFYGLEAPEQIRNMEFIYVSPFDVSPINVTKDLTNEFPNAEIIYKCTLSAEERKAEKKFVIYIMVVASYVDVSNMNFDEAASSEKRIISGNMFFVDVPNKIPVKLNINEHSSLSLIRKIFRTEKPLPSHLKMSEVTEYKEIVFSPLESAYQALDSKTRELIRIHTANNNRNLLLMSLNGIVNALVNGGTKFYVEAFLSKKFFETYPEQKDKCEILINSLKIQMDYLKRVIDSLYHEPPDVSRPLLNSIRNAYNVNVNYFKTEINIECSPLDKITETPVAENENPHIRSNSIVMNSGHASHSVTNINSSPPEDSKSSDHSPHENNVFSSGFATLTNHSHQKVAAFVSKKMINPFGSLRRSKPISKVASGFQSSQSHLAGGSMHTSSLASSSNDIREEVHKTPSFNNSKSGSTSSPSSVENKPSSLKTLFSKRN